MFKKVDKVLAAFGNIKAMERLHVDTFTENIISEIEGAKIGESREGQLYLSFQELNGYLFLETTILSAINIKTKKGATLVFSNTTNAFTLKSDTIEIEADFSNVSNRYITKVSFYVSKEEVKQIQAKEYNTIKFEFKKKALTFNTVTS